MDFKIYKFKITGLSPLLCNNPALTIKEGMSKKLSFKEQAEKVLYHNGKNFGFPSTAFRKSFFSGLVGKKIGKFNVKTLLKPVIHNVDDFVTLIDPKTMKPLKKWEVDEKVVTNSTGGKLIKARPRFDNWACLLYLEIDLTPVPNPGVDEPGSEPIDTIVNHMNNAGYTIGVGDFRPDRDGRYGRFKVELMD